MPEFPTMKITAGMDRINRSVLVATAAKSPWRADGSDQTQTKDDADEMNTNESCSPES